MIPVVTGKNSNIVPATPDAIATAAGILRRGGLVAFPTETVYGLGAHALDPVAVRKIFAAKERPDWDPLIVHVCDIAMAEALAFDVPEDLTKRFWPGPLTLVLKKRPHVPAEVTAGLDTVALRMPRHPVAVALLRAANLPVAAPSANLFGRPSPTRAEHVAADLGDRVDLILDAGPTEIGVESTILDLTQSPPVILRPGGVPREQLGDVTVSNDRRVLAPGMTVKHYSPRARVELFDGDLDAQLAALNQRVDELTRAGQSFRILINQADNDWLAQHLYAQLRQFDAENVDVILCTMPPADGIGLAVRDRLRRAAGIP